MKKKISLFLFLFILNFVIFTSNSLLLAKILIQAASTTKLTSESIKTSEPIKQVSTEVKSAEPKKVTFEVDDATTEENNFSLQMIAFLNELLENDDNLIASQLAAIVNEHFRLDGAFDEIMQTSAEIFVAQPEKDQINMLAQGFITKLKDENLKAYPSNEILLDIIEKALAATIDNEKFEQFIKLDQSMRPALLKAIVTDNSIKCKFENLDSVVYESNDEQKQDENFFSSSFISISYAVAKEVNEDLVNSFKNLSIQEKTLIIAFWVANEWKYKKEVSAEQNESIPAIEKLLPIFNESIFDEFDFKNPFEIDPFEIYCYC